ncbi:hypothetical protein SAMN02910289_00886 [Lachnospiraceae bacterium RM5]|nr:hypothetical protein SAMN02910289_00886 [Lachnospiraceae bacterium RM5]
MRKNNEKRTDKRKLVAALGMLCLSGAMLVGTTYAWFTMNKTVSVEGMKVQAVAEEGLLVNEVATANDTNWDSLATANQTTDMSLLYPASTANGTTWYHAASSKSNDAAAASGTTKSANLIGNDYETLPSLTAITDMSNATAVGGSKAAFSTMGRSATADAGYYVHYTYYLKASSGTAIPLGTTTGAQNVNIKGVTATINPGSGSGSANLDKSLRVGIFMKSGGTFYIYAPVAGYTSSYNVAASATATSPIAGGTATATDLETLPAVGQSGTPVEVYIWYEGEDANCKSDNALAATLDNIDVKIDFELKAVS